jgi:glyoxylase-like metal-dependent hydrolase (beta-lactamase superfamily II)
MEIIHNVHLVPEITANPYLVIDSDGLTLIDAGLPGSDKKILRYMTDLGYSADDLKRIIITHADFDHVGGLAALKNATGARIYASEIEAAAFAVGRSSRELRPDNLVLKLLILLIGRFAKTSPVRADELIIDGQVLPVLGGLHVLETSGHTPGHLSLFSPSAGILFCGDSIVTDKNGLHGSKKANTWDQARANDALLRQATLGAQIVCSGHGPVIMDAHDKFQMILKGDIYAQPGK